MSYPRTARCVAVGCGLEYDPSVSDYLRRSGLCPTCYGRVYGHGKLNPGGGACYPRAEPSRVQTAISRALAQKLVDAWARHVFPSVPVGHLNDLISDVAEALDAARAP